MISQIANTLILGLPIVAYGGFATLLAFTFTAAIGYTNHHGIKWIPFKWHPRMVMVSFTFAIIHAFFGLSIFLGY